MLTDCRSINLSQPKKASLRYHTDICVGKKKFIPKPDDPILMSWNPETAKRKFQPQKSHTCIVCSTVFPSEKSIDKHYHTEHKGKQYKEA